MSAIHLIRKDDPSLPQITPVKEIGGGVYSSGDWKVPETKVDSLMGGEIYFHRAKSKPSFFGGVIIGAEPSKVEGRVVFVFRFEPGCRGFRTPPNGWSQEKKYGP